MFFHVVTQLRVRTVNNLASLLERSIYLRLFALWTTPIYVNDFFLHSVYFSKTTSCFELAKMRVKCWKVELSVAYEH